LRVTIPKGGSLKFKKGQAGLKHLAKFEEEDGIERMTINSNSLQKDEKL